MLAIFKRETKSYFTGMIGYVVIGVMLAFIGLYYSANCIVYGTSDFSIVLYSTTIAMLFVLPALSMRSFADERRNKTDQLLLTSPVPAWGIVLGKYLAMCAVFALPCLADAAMILALRLLGSTGTALASNFASLLGYYLLGCAAIALCEWISGLTENQIVAAVLGFVALLLAFLMPSLRSLFSAGSTAALVIFTLLAAAASVLAGLRSRSLTLGCVLFAVLAAGISALFLFRSGWLTGAFSAVLEALCLFAPFERFVNGSFSVQAVVYYLSAAGLFLFFAAQGLEKRRWV